MPVVRLRARITVELTLEELNFVCRAMRGEIHVSEAPQAFLMQHQMLKDAHEASQEFHGALVKVSPPTASAEVPKEEKKKK